MVRLLLIILFVGILFTGRGFVNLYKLERKLNELREKNEEIIEENGRLKEEIKRFKNKEYVKRVIKEELGLIEDGENIYYFIEDGR